MATESEIDDPVETTGAGPETGDREPKTTEVTKVPTRTRPAATAKAEPEADPENLDDALEMIERLRRRERNLAEEKDRHRRKADELRSLAEEKQREQDAKLSEAEKLGKTLAARERELADATALAGSLQDQLIHSRISFAIQLKAYEMNFKYPADVPGLIRRDAIECDDDNEPLPASVEKALKKLAEARPDYLETTRGGTPGREPARRGAAPGRGGPGRNDPHEQDLAAMGLGGRM